MKNDDVQLIQRVLDGDDTAFTTLVKKYQRSVHALAWRKVGDFHIAEDIAQDAFLKAYQRLSTLKEPQSFSSWLYVITANHCKAWLRKKRTWMQSLEDTNTAQLEKATYSGHIIAENERMTEETQREVVKKLLSKLQESDRTVITLYYLGGMTYEEISNFLGVSVGAIKSRLHRARQRLKKEEPMIREALGNFQITPNLAENIMREVSRLKPVVPSGSKPLVPWAIGVSALVVVFLMLGVGNRYLSRFQKPYSFDATSEMTVELIEAPIVLNLESKPDIRTQLGSTAAPSKTDGTGQRPDDLLFAAAQADGEDVPVPKQQWIQAGPIKGSRAEGLLATSEGELYAFADMQIYKLEANGKEGRHIFDFNPLVDSRPTNAPLAKWKDTLYIMLANELFASKDDGQRWDLVHTLPDRHYYAIGLILTERAFYAAFEDGIFRSEDNGKTWKAINEGLMGDIRAIVNIQDTLFAGTGNGLYRLSADRWQRVEFPVSVGRIRSAAATEEKLYVVAEMTDTDPRKVSRGLQRAWSIFRSTDLGSSWDDITPTKAWPVKGWPPFIKLIAAGDTLLAMERGMVHSTDSGDTWLPPQLPGTSPTMNADVNIAIAVNENVFYAGSGEDGLHHSTDAGKSWDLVNITPNTGHLNTGQIGNLIVYRESNKGNHKPLTLYAGYAEKVVKTTDKGTSWQDVQIEIPMTEPDREELPRITHIVKADGKIYAKGGDLLGRGETRLYRVSTDSNSLVPIQDMPIFDAMELTHQIREIRMQGINGSNLPEASVIEQLREKAPGADEFFRQLAKWDPRQPDILYTQLGFRKGTFAVSGDTFYMEYNYKLFRWEPGDTEWYDTEQEETVELTPQLAFRELKLAASGNTVYVGKRDGHLVASFDKGNNWLDLTPNLPFPVKAFYDMVFVDSTVYVATDTGVAASSGGKQWHVIPNASGTPPIIGRLAADGTTLYGVSKSGVYRLENNTWKEIVSEIPNRVTSLAADGNVLYVGTQDSGVFHFNLDE